MKKRRRKKRKANGLTRNQDGVITYPGEQCKHPVTPMDMREIDTSRLLRDLKNQPHESALRVRASVGLWREGKETEAIATLNDGLRLKPRDATLAHCMGILYAEKERYELAQEWLHRALQWDDQQVESYYYLGLTYAAQQNFDSAFVHLQKASQLRAGDTTIQEALNVAGQCMQKQAVPMSSQSFPLIGQVSEHSAATAVDRLTDMIVEESDYVLTFLHNTTGQQGNSELMLLLDALDQAIQRYPDHADLLYYRGVVLDRLNQVPLAIRSIRKSLRINDQYKDSLIYLGKLYQKAGRHAQAIRTFDRAIEAGAAYADVYLLLGRSYQQTNQADSARDAYEHALLINEQFYAAQEALATLAA